MLTDILGGGESAGMSRAALECGHCTAGGICLGLHDSFPGAASINLVIPSNSAAHLSLSVI